MLLLTTVCVPVHVLHGCVSYVASIGCVMRNISGYWLDAYYGIMPYESDIVTELMTIFYGFKLADEQDVGCVEVESCSQNAVNQYYTRILFVHADIVHDIRELMNSTWACSSFFPSTCHWSCSLCFR